MTRKITITVYNRAFTCVPDKKVNRTSTVTFRLAAERSYAELTLDPDCFDVPSIILSRDSNPPVISKDVGIKSTIGDGCYGFSTPPAIQASQAKRGKQGDEIGPLVGDVEVVTDPIMDKDHRKKGANATASQPALSAV